MRSIVLLQPSARLSHNLNWLSPIQAVFAFFSPQRSVKHAQPIFRAELSPKRDAFFAVEASTVPKNACRPAQFVLNPASVQKQITSSRRNCQVSSLKVLREFEPGKSRSSTGRLVISGRMADVCAVLDRMATHGAASS